MEKKVYIDKITENLYKAETKTKPRALGKIFDINGLTTEYRKEAKANRIILSYCHDWLGQIESYTGHDKFIFSYSVSSWLNNILLKVETYAKPIHKLLTGQEINTSPRLSDIEEDRLVAFNRIVNTNIIYLLRAYQKMNMMSLLTYMLLIKALAEIIMVMPNLSIV